MKRVTILLLSVVQTLCCSLLHAQNDTVREKELDLPGFLLDEDYEEMNLEYKLPEGFTHRNKFVETTAMFFYGLHGVLESQDKELLLLVDIPYFHTKKDSARLSMFQSADRQNLLSPNSMHRNTLNADFRNIDYYKKTMPSIESKLTFYSPDKARDFYNADSVIIYNLNIKDHPYYYLFKEEEPELMGDPDKYKYCRAVMLQKRDRSFLVMYLFYSDKAAKDIDEYVERLKGIFWFRED